MPDEEYKLRVNLYDYELELKNSLIVSDYIEPSYGNGHYFKACILIFRNIRFSLGIK